MFSDAIRLFFSNPIIGLPNVVAALLSTALSRLLVNTSYFEGLQSSSVSTLDSLPAGLAMSLSQVILFILLVTLIEPFVQAATALLCVNVVEGKSEALKGTLHRSLKFYWRLFGVLFFKFFLFIGIVIAAVVIVFPSISRSFNGADITSANIGSFFLIILVLLVVSVLILVLNAMLLPIEPLLVYREYSLGDAISKGFKFGLRKFFPIIGAAFATMISAGILNYIISIFIGSNAGISSITTTFLSAFLVLYVICLSKADLAADGSAYAENQQSDKQDLQLPMDYLQKQNDSAPSLPPEPPAPTESTEASESENKDTNKTE